MAIEICKFGLNLRAKTRYLYYRHTGLSQIKRKDVKYIWEPGCKVAGIIIVSLLKYLAVNFADFGEIWVARYAGWRVVVSSTPKEGFFFGTKKKSETSAGVRGTDSCNSSHERNLVAVVDWIVGICNRSKLAHKCARTPYSRIYCTRRNSNSEPPFAFTL